jgi:hypothetical protein
MLNSWDNPFGQFTDNANNVANATIAPADVSDQVSSADIKPDVVQAAPVTPKAPHAGDGIVSNEQLMSTAGAAPQVNPIIADAGIDTPVTNDADLSGTGLEQIEMGIGHGKSILMAALITGCHKRST